MLFRVRKVKQRLINWEYKMKNKKRNRDGFFKDTLIEFIFEVVWNILMFIPRMIIRLIGNIW